MFILSMKEKSFLVINVGKNLDFSAPFSLDQQLFMSVTADSLGLALSYWRSIPNCENDLIVLVCRPIKTYRVLLHI